MLNWYKFEVELKNGRKKVLCKSSKHITGAVRKLCQEYEIERFIRILPA